MGIKQKAENTIEFSKNRVTIFLTKAIYDTIENIARTKYKDSRSVNGVIQTYAIIQLYSRLSFTNTFVSIHKEIFEFISKRNYVNYRALLCEHKIIEYRKSEYAQYKTITGESRITSTTTEYRMAGVIGVLFDNDVTIPVHIAMPSDYILALKRRHKHIGEEYLFSQERRKSIMDINPMEIVIVDKIINLIKDIVSNKIKTQRTFEKRVNQIDNNKGVYFDCNIYDLIKRLVRIIKVNNNKQIAGNNLAYLFDNQSDIEIEECIENFNFYRDLRVEVGALDECIIKRDLMHISRINTIPDYSNGGKIYSALANIRKPIRKYVTYNGANLVEVSDISCAHFTMLPVIFKRYNIRISNDEMHRYKNLTQCADLYGTVVEGTDVSRNDIKLSFQPFLSIKNRAQFLFGQNGAEYRKREIICDYFDKHFPEIFNALLSWHTHTKISIKSVANEVESDIINPICEKLIVEGLHPFRIHDAIYLPSNEIEHLTFNIKDAVMRHVNQESAV